MINLKKSVLTAFVCFWILDSAILFLARRAYPFYFVLGTRTMSFWMSVIVAGFIWTLLVWLADPVVNKFTKIKGKILMFGFYFLVNFVALWLTARLAPVSGFGATSFIWLVYLALFANVVQYLVWKICNFAKIMK